MKRIAIACVLALLAPGAQAQISPYSGLQTRPIKALSEQQLTDLREGRGHGLALPAELNGYPGPSHVLELADKLHLSPDQRTRVQTLFAAMKAEAMPIGERIIADEAALDRHFAERTITLARLNELTAEIGRRQGELRAAHLKYHLATIELLTPHQVGRYRELRGYGASGHRPSHQGTH